MHRVRNCGSVLQAFALQKIIAELGYKVEIIDYEYPYRQDHGLARKWDDLKTWVRNQLHPNTFSARFHRFIAQNYRLSRKFYYKGSIEKCPPKYDIYVTGSDQVWNPRWMCGDTNFLLDFAPDEATRLSYASSFATSEIPSEYRDTYVRCLNKYDEITVREEKGTELVKELTGRNAELTVDPTLLLSADSYKQMAEQSAITIKEPFILAYIMSYMFDPYPQVQRIIEKVKAVLGHNVYIVRGKNPHPENPSYISLSDVGPAEFVWLFANASFVITTSFHGTAFSLINQVPLFSVVQSEQSSDDRITSLLSRVDQTKSIIAHNDIPTEEQIRSSEIVASSAQVQNLREESAKLLADMLGKYDKT